jgi:hypothetical protein
VKLTRQRATASLMAVALALLSLWPAVAYSTGALYPPLPYGEESGTGVPPKVEQLTLSIARGSTYYRALRRFDDGYWQNAFRWKRHSRLLGAQAVFEQDVGFDFGGNWLWLRYCPAGSKRAYVSIPYWASYRSINGFIADVDLTHRQVVGFQPELAADPQIWQVGPARFAHSPNLAGACR